MPSSSIFAALPSEVILQILEHAAASSTRTALALALVSSWVRAFTEPFLYHTVVLSTARALAAFHSALLTKPPTFAHTNIRHLGVFAPGPVETVDKILSLCSTRSGGNEAERGLQSLACGFSLPAYKDLYGAQPLHVFTALRSCTSVTEQHLLALSCRDGWDPSLVAPSVTHLRVHVTSPQRPWFTLPGGANTTLEGSSWELRYLPKLTHLGIVWKPGKEQSVEDVLVPLTRLLDSPSPSDSQSSPSANNTTTTTTEEPLITPSKLSLILIQILGPRASQARAVEALNAAACAQGGVARRVVAECAPLSAVSQWEDYVRTGEHGGVWKGAEAVVGKRLTHTIVQTA